MFYFFLLTTTNFPTGCIAAGCPTGQSTSDPNGLELLGASLIAQLVKNPPAMQENLDQEIPGSGRPAGEGIGYPLQYT